MSAVRPPRPISQHIAWVLTGAVTLTVVVFAAVVSSANESLEQQYHQRLVQTERAHVLREFHQSGERRFESALALSYLVDPATREPRPVDWLADYVPGDYEVEELDGRDYFISVESLPEGLLYIAVDNTGPEQEENIFDLTIQISALLLVALSVQLGRVLSHRLAEPLKRLADDVEQFDASTRGQRLPAHGESAQTTETRRIAEVFNAYSQRLDDFIEREQHLTAMASHELRTPLAVLSGAAEVLEQRLAGDEANRKTLQRIREAALEMRDSVEAILELSRHAGDSAAQSCRADELVQALVLRQRDAAEARGLVVHCEVQAVTLKAHPQLVQILLSNLLGNALRHTARGEVRIHLSALELCITDSGSGIDARDLPRLMMPGGRGAHAASEGAGLGLYIARKVCERYGWSLSLSNLAEGGACVRVRFTLGK